MGCGEGQRNQNEVYVCECTVHIYMYVKEKSVVDHPRKFHKLNITNTDCKILFDFFLLFPCIFLQLLSNKEMLIKILTSISVL